ncbi:prepronociceptin-like [Myxocyprinus asiaticus]|uniref:prepronociceptin-like n=1 Tax=Myxocyprinus asiaticus TaxID=70543 RepID=UPI0022214EE3|nr:prepronociceptin-like [Myxocyprinus asiaticus]
MKTPLWMLLLLGLCNPTWCDCQEDCLFCSQQLPKEYAFSNLMCLVECHGKLSPDDSWELCHRTIVEQEPKASFPIGGTMLKREDEDADTFLPLDENDSHYSETLQRFNHVTRAAGAEDQDQDQNMQLSKNYKFLQVQSKQESEDEQNGDSEMEGDEGEAAIHLIKRFGGFLKNKYGYRKFMDPGRSLQKRYGGFIGVRKSARKWNNQKRFSEFLKQYMGMSTRASKFNSMSADITQENE